MNNQLVQSTEIYRCKDDDRVVVIHKQNNEITGINFAQDADMDLYEFIELSNMSKIQIFFVLE